MQKFDLWISAEVFVRKTDLWVLSYLLVVCITTVLRYDNDDDDVHFID